MWGELVTSVLLSPVCTWMEELGDGGLLLMYFFAFFSIIYILGLVCYKHSIHVGWLTKRGHDLFHAVSCGAL